MAVICSKCGTKQGMLDSFMANMGSGPYVCLDCSEKQARIRSQNDEEDRQAVKEKAAQLRAASQKVVLTTTPGIDGHRIRKYLGIESVEFVIGTGAFSEISSSISDFFGARSSAFEQKLRAAKQHAMDALKYAAAEKGANAVVAVDLDYTEFTGNRIALIINGTLVVVEPIPKA